MYAGAGDAFHLMNIFDLPLHHEYRPASLRAAVFILHDREWERAQKIAEKKGWKWSQVMAFNFERTQAAVYESKGCD
jgi:hypothetical protein